jgi:hypothetical protein
MIEKEPVKKTTGTPEKRGQTIPKPGQTIPKPPLKTDTRKE